ncbi:AraC family transcriptional regulator [Xanthomonas campestris pv. campestris]|jgi:AraC-like DNA-binding protein|uniref:Transcriptional regulator n=3 Tax=Gammaproteobacteria TaxID=1236 RepID=Q8PDM4_XANCP|nr:AraC family transcriptional regulator [Xanthomonas campestris]AAM39630.1 transcriptional regulator [Xanthomonas campestris pv. campestris str. ATCC 33913]AAY47408.1 transcriptional regulator [Xanthomonas campestris pv. campestris str. 8004]AKS14735.1 AraC family transcriptional regulator [Xanthomonas campestris pv. campestris]MBD8247123.1 AraC family transcriptional regulator [Xanthomonas campestris]MCC5051864.1 AraC family transcriptional regulator [Xanthomonas campestris pv. aberrans]
MLDPLAEVVLLLRPAPGFSKLVLGAGVWSAYRSDAPGPFYCAVIEGKCRLALEGGQAHVLEAGDFVLAPAMLAVTLSSAQASTGQAHTVPTQADDGSFRIGAQDGPADVRIVIGHCSFGSPDAALLVSLLPRLVHVRGELRLTTLVNLVGEEARTNRPARAVVLARLLEVLLIEALRSLTASDTTPGLVRALSDARLAAALRAMHGAPAHAWTIDALAKEAALSRSSFFARFNRAMGVTPMEYLLAWRMALAKTLLSEQGLGVAQAAQRVGYGSASSFSVAFTRHTGSPPSQYARVRTATSLDAV